MKMYLVNDAACLDALEKRYLRLLGQYVNDLRIQRRMSQEALARAAGLSRTETHKIEHGVTSVKVTTMWRLCGALRIAYGEVVAHMDYVMGHPECEPPHGRLKTRRGVKG